MTTLIYLDTSTTNGHTELLSHEPRTQCLRCIWPRVRRGFNVLRKFQKLTNSARTDYGPSNVAASIQLFTSLATLGDLKARWFMTKGQKTKMLPFIGPELVAHLLNGRPNRENQAETSPVARAQSDALAKPRSWENVRVLQRWTLRFFVDTKGENQR